MSHHILFSFLLRHWTYLNCAFCLNTRNFILGCRYSLKDLCFRSANISCYFWYLVSFLRDNCRKIWHISLFWNSGLFSLTSVKEKNLSLYLFSIILRCRSLSEYARYLFDGELLPTLSFDHTDVIIEDRPLRWAVMGKINCSKLHLPCASLNSLVSTFPTHHLREESCEETLFWNLEFVLKSWNWFYQLYF